MSILCVGFDLVGFMARRLVLRCGLHFCMVVVVGNFRYVEVVRMCGCMGIVGFSLLLVEECGSFIGCSRFMTEMGS